MKKNLIILFLFYNILAQCPDSVYQDLTKLQIRDMTDRQYNCFKNQHFSYERGIDCNDKNYHQLLELDLNAMTDNEFDYFVRIFDEYENCPNFNPCQLSQFKSLFNLPKDSLAEREMEFFEDCEDECETYNNMYSNEQPYRRKRRFKRGFKIASFSVAGIAGSLFILAWIFVIF